jgi:tetratricopeptide (TPR) repeat protein
MGKTDESIRYMNQVIALDPTHADALNHLGYTYAEQGIKLDEAEELIQKALEIKPKSGYITDSLGWVYYQKKEYPRAVEWLEKAARLVPDDPTISEHLGDGYSKVNKKEKALQMYQRALELKPDKEREAILHKKIEELKETQRP